MLVERWGDMPTHILEALAIEGYRSGVLTEFQVGRMLGFSSRTRIVSFLAERGIFPDYSEAQLNQDLQTARHVAEKHDHELNR